MIKNYFTIALRNFLRNKAFSLINVFGLSIGVSAALVIFMLVQYHFNFDKFEKEGNRIYRVVSVFGFSGETYYNSGVPGPMGRAVEKELTGLEAVIPLRTEDGDAKITLPAKGIGQPVILKQQQDIVYADKRFFSLLGYEWLAGNAATASEKNYQAVLTLTRARLYFPSLKPSEMIGRDFFMNDSVRLTVSGIVKDISYNTDFSFKTFISLNTLENTSLRPGDWNEWNNTNGATQLFIKLSPGTNPQKATAAIAALYKKYHKQEPGDKSTTEHQLQPLADMHFNGQFGGYNNPIGNKPVLFSLMTVAVILLLLACINFINLTTANASQRAKEIGIRKTMGSSRKQLVMQFLSETFLLTLAAALISVCLAPLIFKAFSGFLPAGLRVSTLQQPVVIIFLILLVLTVTIIAGFYPAIVLSGYKPVLVLKNQAYANTGKTRTAWLRKSLTLSQFVIAQVFIMGVLLVGKQINYTLNKDLGFKKEAILNMQINYYDTVRSNKYVLMQKLKAIPEIAMLSLSNSAPSSTSGWTSTMKFKDGKKEVEADVQQKYGDSNYIKLFQLKLLAGRNLHQSDTANEFIINETFAHTLGFLQPGDAIGKSLEWSNKQLSIIGVVADFNFASLHTPVKPLVIGSWNNVERTISVALQPRNENGSNWKAAIEKMGIAWKTGVP